MHRFYISVLTAFVLAAGLSGCDESKLSPLASSDALGAVSFRLSAADSSVLSGTVDSVLLRAISGSDTESIRGPIGSALVLSGLPEGPCSLEAFLFGKNGALLWSGHDTVQIRAGVETPATLILHKATGSVRVTTVLDSSQANDSNFTLYTLIVHRDYPIEFTYTLDAKGNIILVRNSYTGGAKAFDTTYAQLSSTDLAYARNLLESMAARHPGTIPERIAIDTVIQNGDTTYIDDSYSGGDVLTRTVAYANGTSDSLMFNSNTQDESANWSVLDPVDNLLEALLPMRYPLVR